MYKNELHIGDEVAFAFYDGWNGECCLRKAPIKSISEDTHSLVLDLNGLDILNCDEFEEGLDEDGNEHFLEEFEEMCRDVILVKKKEVEKIDFTEEAIRKVLRLSDDADKAFKEDCRLVIGVTINERIDNMERLRRQQSELSSEERIKYIKDHWNDEKETNDESGELQREKTHPFS